MARNKGRDVIGDYYKTNKAIEKENDNRIAKEEKNKKWSRNEIIMVAVIVLCAVGIVLKYFVWG